MPKTPSNKLFRLVKSLSGSEKRYFKIFVNSDDEKSNKYIRLFDAVDTQDVFDEEALKKVIYKNQVIESRKYSELKAYLYDLILKSLQSYDEKSSVDYRLKGMLLGVRTLFKRSHFEDCKELLYKAKKLAGKFENFNTILEILSWEKKIAYAQTNITFLDKELGRIDKEERRCLEQLQNISAYRNLFFSLLLSIRKDASRRGQSKRDIQQIIENDLVQNKEKAITHQSEILYFRIQSVYHYAEQSLQEFYDTNKKLLELMEDKPHFLKEDISEYISSLSNLIVSCGYLQKSDEIEDYLLKIKSLKPNTIDDELKIHRQYYQNFFANCIKTGAFEKALLALPGHFKESLRFDKQLFLQNSFYYQYFYIYFGNDNHEKALEYLNEWLNLPRSIERQDLQSMARIMNLVIHYEMGNTLLLESLLRSTYRFLKKGERLFLFEEKMMQFIKKTIKAITKKEVQDALLTLKNDLKELSAISSEKTVFDLFNFEAWIDSKIEKIPFSDAVKKQFSEKRKLGI